MSPCCWFYFFATTESSRVSGGRRRREKKNHHPSHRVQPPPPTDEGPSTSSFATRTQLNAACCCGWLRSSLPLLPLSPAAAAPTRSLLRRRLRDLEWIRAARDNLFVADNLRRVSAAAADSSASNFHEASSLATLSCRVLVAQIALTSFSNCLTSPHDACLPAAMISVHPYLNICS